MAKGLEQPLLPNSRLHSPPPPNRLSCNGSVMKRMLLLLIICLTLSLIFMTIVLLYPNKFSTSETPKIVSAYVNTFHVRKPNDPNDIRYTITLCLDTDVANVTYDAITWVYRNHDNTVLVQHIKKVEEKTHSGQVILWSFLQAVVKHVPVKYQHDPRYEGRVYNGDFVDGVSVFDMLVEANVTYNYGSGSRSEFVMIDCNDLKIEFSEDMIQQGIRDDKRCKVQRFATKSDALRGIN